MNFSEQLLVLESTQGDAAKQALSTVDFRYPELPEQERVALKQALEVASIPHWCDELILADLLEVSVEESIRRLVQLQGLKVVESFRARGHTAINVHESSRLTLRNALHTHAHQRFLSLSLKTAKYFENDPGSAKRIEWIYHLLCGDPAQGSAKLKALDLEWGSSAYPEVYYALSVALKELTDSMLLEKGARMRALLVIGSVYRSRGESAQLESVIQDVLLLAVEIDDADIKAEARTLQADVLAAHGDLAAALAALSEALAINQHLVEGDQTNAYWQHELAVARERIGGILKTQGNLVAAHTAFAEALAIIERLVQADPNDAGWQCELAVAYDRVGGIQEAQGNIVAAQKAFARALEINRQLVKADPDNAGWRRDLAVAHARMGGVLEIQGDLAAAHTAFAKALAIHHQLVEADPSNALWQGDLARTYTKMGGILQAQGSLAAAQQALVYDMKLNRLVDPMKLMDQTDQVSTSMDTLTDREQQILKAVAEGFSVKEIAAKLAISMKTVETQRAVLMEKLKPSRINKVRNAGQQG